MKSKTVKKLLIYLQRENNLNRNLEKNLVKSKAVKKLFAKLSWTKNFLEIKSLNIGNVQKNNGNRSKTYG